LEELEDPKSVQRYESPDRPCRIHGLGDRAVWAQQESSRMQKAALGFDERASELMDLFSIGAMQYRIRLDSQPLDKRPSGIAVVNRHRNDLGALLCEEWNDVIEVNQLLTAIRSPVAPVEQHHTPRTVEQIRNDYLRVVESQRRDLRKLLVHTKLHRNPPH
jgi:hypothetical protein